MVTYLISVISKENNQLNFFNMLPHRKHTQEDYANEFVNDFFYKFGNKSGLDFVPRKPKTGQISPNYEDAVALQSGDCPTLLVAKQKDGVICTCYSAKDGHKLIQKGFLPLCFVQE